MESPFPSPALDAASALAPLPADLARELLRRVRDLDLYGPWLVLSGGRRVQIDGCLSGDSPVESSLRYRVRVRNEPDHVIEIGWTAGRLLLEAREGERSERRLSLPVHLDGEGRATIPAIRARIHPRTTDRREVEHFLRRLVRAAFARR